MLKQVTKRLEAQNIKIEIDNQVKELIAKKGVDNNYGARPLRRLIQRKVEDSLAEEILSGKYAPGDTIRLTLTDGKITFEKAAKRRSKKEKTSADEKSIEIVDESTMDDYVKKGE